MGFNIASVELDYKKIRLSPYHFDSEDNIFTVMIGKNGTGKSRLLSTLTNAFCTLHVGNKLLKRDISEFAFISKQDDVKSINYFTNGYEHNIYIRGRSIQLNDLFTDYSMDVLMPSKVISSSTSPFDKFPLESDYFSKNRGKLDDNFYSYFGLKDNNRNQSLKNLFEKIIYSSAQGKTRSEKSAFVNILDFLNYQPRISAVFRLRHNIDKLMYELENGSIYDFMRYISKLNISKIQDTEDYDQVYDSLRTALYYINGYLKKTSESDRNIYINIDYRNDSMSVPEDFFKMTSVLFELGVMLIKDIALYPKKDHSKYAYDWDGFISLNDASSGQQCILLSTLGIASSIIDNSLILIDEPEISLHPEWQEKYIELLMQVFKDYRGCHFIIATHSPQIISKLSAHNCYISQIEKGELYSSNEYIEKSADYQLATLFNSPGNDNEFLKRIAVNILTRISSGKKFSHHNIQEIQILEDQYQNLTDADPVKELIELIFECRRESK